MKSSKDILLQTSDLSIGYHKKREDLVVMNNLNLSLKQGQLVCFMGPNGVGKSTLLRTLCGTQTPLDGHIFLKERKLSDLDKSEIALQIGVVLTDPINVGNITVRELVSFGRYPYTSWNISFTKKDTDIIDWAINETKLNNIEHKKIAELSDGQRQKTLIARALCQDTPIIILDEPTAHLDLNNRVEVINLLKRLAHSTGKSIVMATHELDLTLQAADHLWLSGFNQPVVEGFPEDLVLTGRLDEIFQLKGFDLKTGVLTKTSLGKTIALEGSGFEYLWTKNALERHGYEIHPNAETKINIHKKTRLEWHINNEIVTSLEQLINKLSSIK